MHDEIIYGLGMIQLMDTKKLRMSQISPLI